MSLSAGHQSDPSIRYTTANGSQSIHLESSKRLISGHVQLFYSHGVRVDGTGAVSEAYQQTCLTFDINYCKLTSGSPPCVSAVSGCAQFINPLDPFEGWTKVGHANGVADFLGSQLVPRQMVLFDQFGNNRGTASISCQYKGTIY